MSTSAHVRKSRSSEKYKPKPRNEEIEFEVFNDNESEERIYADNEYEDDQLLEKGEGEGAIKVDGKKEIQYKITDGNTNQQMFNNNLTNNSTHDNRSQGPISGVAQILNQDPA
jgi:hypothetical protein